MPKSEKVKKPRKTSKKLLSSQEINLNLMENGSQSSCKECHNVTAGKIDNTLEKDFYRKIYNVKQSTKIDENIDISISIHSLEDDSDYVEPSAKKQRKKRATQTKAKDKQKPNTVVAKVGKNARKNLNKIDKDKIDKTVKVLTASLIHMETKLQKVLDFLNC